MTDWEKELEREFYPYIEGGKGYELKSFITKLLEEKLGNVARYLIEANLANKTLDDVIDHFAEVGMKNIKAQERRK